MAVEERRPSSHVGGEPERTRLRGTTGVTLDAVEARWSSTIEREALSGAREARAIRRVTEHDALGAVDERWVRFLAQNIQISAFVWQQTSRLLGSAADACVWGPLARCIELESSMHTRQAQNAVLYAIDLEALGGEMPLEHARAQWVGGRAWQPARRALSGLSVIDDWGETVVAINLCFEPLIGQLMRYEWGTLLARTYGDATTPVVAEATQVHYAWARDWTAESVRALTADERHGEHNRRLIERWVQTWTPPARAAADALTALTDELPDPSAGTIALASVLADQQGLLAELGLDAERAA
jgi:hypothetical protein